jgi:anti-sigma-K factor RskA
MQPSGDLAKAVSVDSDAPAARPPLRPTFAALASVIVLLIGAGGWFAGGQYARLGNQQVAFDLVNAQRSVANLRVELEQRNAQIADLKRALELAGAKTAAAQMDSLHRQVMHQQANLNEYQSLSERDKKAVSQNERLLNVLSHPGVGFLALRRAKADTAAVAYALVVQNSKILVLASYLPKAPAGLEYQLWLTRNADPKIVSIGTLDPDDSGRAQVEFEDDDLVSGVSELTVTEEPGGGSKAPTGPKIFITPPAGH